MSDHAFDLLFIGGGPAGYVGAIRAAQLGFKTACVERYPSLGGTCLNVGCIPSKALLESSEHFATARKDLASHGVRVAQVDLDLTTLLQRKSDVVTQLTNGINHLFKKNKITRITGHAAFIDPHTLRVRHQDAEEIVRADRIIIATGSKPTPLPHLPFNAPFIVSSTGALSFTEVPKHLIVVGAGVIGLELGSVWARLGAKVSFIEAMPKILGANDSEICRHAMRYFKKQGMDFFLDAKVQDATIDPDAAQVTVTYQSPKGSHQIVGDRLLVAVGRQPYTQGLDLDRIGLSLDERGRIPVDDHFATAVPGVYAVGDVIAGPMLAHKAEHDAITCVEGLRGMASLVNHHTIPYIAYTQPEIAGVGHTEDHLQAQGIPYRKGTFPFLANGRAKAMAQTDGMVKILVERDSDRILGAHIVGPRAGDLIAEVVLAMEFGASAEDLYRTCHAHPNLGEAIKEAALATDGRSLAM